MDRLAKLVELRQKALDEIAEIKEARKALTDKVEAEERADFTEEEDAEFRASLAAVKEKDAVVEDLTSQIKDLEAENERAGRNNEEVQRVLKNTTRTEVKESLTYEKGDPHASYGQDLARKLAGKADSETLARLQRHAVDVASNKELRANVNTTDGTGGEFVPPLWAVQDYVKFARAGRVYANLTRSRTLPPGQDIIIVPKVTTGTSVDVQATQNTALHESSFGTDDVQAPAITIGAFQPISRQALDWSPIRFDEEIFQDLIRAYAVKVDQQVISGAGIGSGQFLGVRNTPGIQTITVTETGTELQKAQALFRAVANGISKVYDGTADDPEVIVMHPRRWAAYSSVLAADGRPAVVASGPGQNQYASFDGVGFDRVVGQMHGFPVVTATHLPTTLGAGTNQDVVHILRPSDWRLYESGIRVEAFRETKATELTVILQVHGYGAFTAGRQAPGVVELTGSAFTAPTFLA